MFRSLSLAGFAAVALCVVPIAWGEHPLVTLYKSGRADLAAGRYEDARSKFNRLLKDLPADQDGLRALALNELGCVQRQLGEFEASKTTFAQSLAVRRKVPGAESRIHEATTYNNLAASHHQVGDYDEAEKAFATSLKILADLKQSTRLSDVEAERRDLQEATTFSNLAKLHRQRSQYPQAENFYERGLKVLAPHQGKTEHQLKRAEILLDQGLYLQKKGEYDRAEKSMAASIELWSRSANSQPMQLARARGNLAALYVEGNQPEKARPLLQASIRTLAELRQKQPQNFETAQALAMAHGSLGYLELTQNRLAEAESHLASCSEILTRIAPNSTAMARCLSSWGMLAQARGQFAEAERRHGEALALRQRLLPAGHPEIALSQQNLALAYAGAGQWNQAMPTMNVARQAIRNYVTRELPSLPRLQQLSFLLNEADAESHVSALHASLAIAVAGKDQDGMADLSAGWLVNGKGVGGEVLAEQMHLERAGRANVDLLRQLNAIRADLTELREQSAAEASPSRPQRLRELTQREQALLTQLGLGSSTRQWLDLDEVRRQIPADAVLIEYARHRGWDLQGKSGRIGWQAPQYVAWVIPPAGKGKVGVVPLGDAATIDAAVRAYLTELQAAIPKEGGKGKLLELGEQLADEEFRRPLAALRGLLLDKVLATPQGAKHLIVSPDSQLWMVPWSALVLPNQHYLVEDHVVQLVGSGRELVRKETGLKLEPPLVLARPRYDLTQAQVVQTARKLFESGEFRPITLRSTTRVDLGRVNFRDLPFAEAEGAAIQEPLEKFARVKPRYLKHAEAAEPVIRAAVRPSVLVLCTHGYFLEDQILEKLQMKPPEDPLDRCGLALAGANSWSKAKDGSEDGVLTAREVLDIDLRGTRLVVLSACQTGLGQVHQGEGVVGMRQAFLLAGAQSVVATLWVVDDRESAELMKEFFERLGEGKSRAEALREAQLKRIAARRERRGAAHPFYWAAFNLTGQN